MSALEQYLDKVLGDAPGYVHAALGHGPHLDESGTYAFAPWQPKRFVWPAGRDKLITCITEAINCGDPIDVFLCPYVLAETERKKGTAVDRRIVHADCDGSLDADRVRLIGGFAVSSGSAGHAHVYVKLATEVTSDQHLILCNGLRAYIGNCDSKFSDNDVLRPPETLNWKSVARGQTAPTAVEWLVEPPDQLVEPTALADLLCVDLGNPAAASLRAAVTSSGAQMAPGPSSAIRWPDAVRAAVALNSGDRSVDTMRIVGACHASGQSLAQARTAVAGRPDLDRRLEGRDDDDVLTCWSKVSAEGLAADGTNDAVGDANTSPSGRTGPSAATRLVDLATSRYSFGLSTDGEPFAIPHVGPAVVRLLHGDKKGLRSELAREYFLQHHRAVGKQAVADALMIIEGTAETTEAVVLHQRVARVPEGWWIDLGDASGHAILIAGSGWTIGTPAVRFRRTVLTAPITMPVRGGDISELWTMLNVTELDWPIVLAFMIAAFIADIPHPILDLAGEQGTGKSTAATIITTLIDPSRVPRRKPPRDPDQWVVAAAGSWVVTLDNISVIPDWLSDALCRACSGDGDVRRKLYSDSGLAVFAFLRVVILTGIDLGAIRGDLAERMVTIELDRITDYRPDKEVTQRWDEAYPRILGALLDLAARVASAIPATRIDKPPRMADFALVLGAVDHVLGTDGLARYTSRAQSVAADSLTADPFIMGLLKGLSDEFFGSSAELLAQFELEDGKRKPKGWPDNAREVTTLLTRQAPAMRRAGWTVERAPAAHANVLRWTIARPAVVIGNEASQPSQVTAGEPAASVASAESGPGTDTICELCGAPIASEDAEVCTNCRTVYLRSDSDLEEDDIDYDDEDDGSQ